MDNEGQDENNVVRLIACDGQEFTIKRKHALLSSTICDMLSSSGEDANEVDTVHLSKMNPQVLKIVCDYLTYKGSHNEKFQSEFPLISSGNAFDVATAAYFLKI